MSTSVKDGLITDFFTERGNCKGCGECCGRFLPLSHFDVARLRGFIERNGVSLQPEEFVDFDGMKINLQCPFLDIHTRECTVYDARPEICRTYRCDKHKRGEFRFPFGYRGMALADMREVFS